MNAIRFLAVISGFALVFGCAGSTNSGGQGLPPYNGSPPIEGPWEFNASSTTSPGQHIYLEVDLTQSASTLSATQLEVFPGNAPALGPLSGCPIPQEPSFSGNLNGAMLTVTLTSGTKTVQFTGEVAPDGKSVSGTYSGGCIPGDNGGTFAASAISPLSGTFSGTLTDARNNPTPTDIQISDDVSGQWITLTATGQGNTFGNALSFSFGGIQTGAYFSGGGTLAMAGTVGPPAPVVVSGHLNPTATVLDHFFMGEPSGSGPVPIFFVVYLGTLSK